MKWSDEYWPLLIQLYKRKPEGVKPLYSRRLVDISLSLHITPQELHRKMHELRRLDTPSLKRLWDELANSRHKLEKAVKTIKQQQGMGNAKEFFKGVATNETFERDFRTVDKQRKIKPVHLIMILALYFHLTPTTMVEETDEVKVLALLLKLPTKQIIEIMEVFQQCDPYVSREKDQHHPLHKACKEVWNRFGNNDLETLETLAAQLREYFR